MKQDKKICYFVSYLLFLVSCFLLLFTTTSCTLQNQNDKKFIRIGYMPNVTHAPALVGINKNFFQDELGSNIKLKPIHFVVGNSIVDAFISNQLDFAYVGPGPFINAVYRRIPLNLLSNATNSGSLIVGVNNITDLKKNMRIAVPQYGNTQDLILRTYLKNNNLLDKVKIIAIPSQDTGTAFFTMSIDAACLPEPWGSILIEKKICKILVNENEIFNGGNYPVTVLVVSGLFAKKEPELVKKILNAHNLSIDYILKNQDDAINITASEISQISKKEIDETIIKKAFQRCTFTNAVNLNILKELAKTGVNAGYYKEGFSKKINIFQ